MKYIPKFQTGNIMRDDIGIHENATFESQLPKTGKIKFNVIWYHLK